MATAKKPELERVFLRLSDDPQQRNYEWCANCGKHIRHHFGAPDLGDTRPPYYRCEPRDDSSWPALPDDAMWTPTPPITNESLIARNHALREALRNVLSLVDRKAFMAHEDLEVVWRAEAALVEDER